MCVRRSLRSAVDKPPRGSRFRAPRPTLPPPRRAEDLSMSSSARGASGALVSRGGRNPEFHSRPERPPRKVRRWWGGHAAYHGQVGPQGARKSAARRLIVRVILRADGAASDPSTLPPIQCSVWSAVCGW